ncbi:MAG: hypothetical protein ABJN35_01750 [Erythrobacter sp.]
MKIALLAAAIVCLAACGNETKTDTSSDASTPESSATATGTATVAADGAPSVGSYRAVDQNGFVLIEELLEDGTYVFSDETGSTIEQGNWTQKSPSELCFLANSEGADEICYLEEISDDGIWLSTNSQTGETATIERLESQPTP